ncbi:MAG: ABC transporter permease subunit [Candidatus Heimdallarchaeota archaeon]|nr:ABC transporter permease subunit [Candidatus Heimdallarchaeota archaeon]
MSKFSTIFKNEAVANRGWFIGWLLGMGITFVSISLMYPGEEGMASLLKLLEDPNFQAFFGDISDSNPGYSLWVAMMFPFISMILFIYSVNSGVKVVTLDTDKGTGEITFSAPVSRRSFYFAKWLAMSIYIMLIISAIIIGLRIPINGNYLETDKLVLLTIHTAIFSLAGVSIGILLGLFTGRGDKGSQIALLSVLVLYTLQSIGNIRDEVDFLNRLNVFELYDSLSIILFNEGDTDSLLVLLAIFVVGLFLGSVGYENKDLIENRGVSFGKYQQRLIPLVSFFHLIFKPFVISARWINHRVIVLFLWIKYRGKVPYDDKTFRIDRSSRTSVFTFWGRALEKRFPIAADFVYSERRVLLITFWAIVMVYPLQLALYPGDEATQELIVGFGSGGIFDLFTYGYDLSTEPYLWYVMTQAIGGHWIFFLPLGFHWVKKVTMSDAESGTGEILGSQPIPYQSIIFQRIIAILLEIVFIVVNMVVFLILSELITGKTDDMLWEIVAILVYIPLYSFWTALLISIALSLKSSGVKIARSIYLLSFLAFAFAVINPDYNHWYVKSIFGLYDPVLIIREQSLMANNGGIIVILFLAILSPFILAFSSRYYTWSVFDKQRDMSTFNKENLVM